MKAVTLVPGTSNVRLADIPEPRVFAKDTVKMRVVRVGICGTDREEASGGRVKASGSSRELVIGHEMLGLVVETGKAVSRVRPGDYAVFTVRRGCGSCVSCLMGRPDMCRSGRYQERGIWGLDGFQAQFVIDSEAYAVRVPSAIEPAGVLTEPLSVAEKAIDEAVRIQNARLPAAAKSIVRSISCPCLIGNTRAPIVSRHRVFRPSAHGPSSSDEHNPIRYGEQRRGVRRWPHTSEERS